MPSNVELNAGSGGVDLLTKQLTHDGDPTQCQGVHLLGISGTEDSYTAATIDGDATNGLDVDVTRSALPTGAATAANQSTANGLLTTIDDDMGTLVTSNAAIQAAVEGTIVVNGSGVTQPVSHAALTELAAAINASSQMDVNIAAQAADITIADGGNSITVDNADITTIAGAVSGSEIQADIVAALPAGDNNIGNVDLASAIPAGTNNIGDVDIATIAAGTNLVGDVGIQGRATGGTSTYYDADLDQVAVVVKASAGTIYAIQAFNTTAAPLFLQLFNVAQGSVTVGTTTPTQQFVIPGNADSDGAGFTFNVPQGKAFGTAITAACTTDSEGSGNPATGACIVNIDYV